MVKIGRTGTPKVGFAGRLEKYYRGLSFGNSHASQTCCGNSCTTSILVHNRRSGDQAEQQQHYLIRGSKLIVRLQPVRAQWLGDESCSEFLGQHRRHDLLSVLSASLLAFLSFTSVPTMRDVISR